VKITSIKQQARLSGRYSVFVDNKYSFSLSDQALLDSKLTNDTEIDEHQLREYKQLSTEDKIYNQTIRYVSLRPRSKWEVEFYMQRKKVSPSLSMSILNKLIKIDLIDDKRFAQAFVHDRNLFRPTSRRKLILELRQKHVGDDIVSNVLIDIDQESERNTLNELIKSKRQQSRYRDDQKLMQYLARQGFNYGDIKAVLNKDYDS
jgi:regulatory protein